MYVENIPFVGGSRPFHIVDYGTGDGGTTIDLMNYAIGKRNIIFKMLQITS